MAESASAALEQRVAELELALLYQERKLETLDGVVREFTAEVERLRAGLTRAQARLAAIEQRDNADAEQDPNW